MSALGLSDYLAAVEERQHLERLLEAGRNEFSGYGLELFESGLRAKIERLSRAIDRHDLQSGYADLSMFCSICSYRNIAETSPITVRPIVVGFSLADNSLSSICDTANVRMIPGPVHNFPNVCVDARSIRTATAARPSAMNSQNSPFVPQELCAAL
jgi:hypothetical protein